MAAKKKVPDHLEPQVASSYEAGVTIRELGTIYSCSPGTIRNILVRRGVALRRPGRRASTGADRSVAVNTTPVAAEGEANAAV